jgi:hypothetical protein
MLPFGTLWVGFHVLKLFLIWNFEFVMPGCGCLDELLEHDRN